MAQSVSSISRASRKAWRDGEQTSASMFRFLRFVYGRAKRPLIGALALLLIVSLSESLSLLLMVPVVGLLTPGRTTLQVAVPKGLRTVFHLSSTVSIQLWWALGSFVILIVIRALAVRAKELQVTAVLYRVVNDLRTQLFGALSRSRWSFLVELRQSDVAHALTADMDRVQTATLQMLLFVQAVIMVTVYGLLSLLISPAMTACAIGLGAAVLLLLAPLRKRASRHGDAFVDARKKQFATVDEFLAAMKMVKAANAEASYVTRLARELDALRDQIIRYMRVSSLAALLFQVVTAVSVAAFVAVGFVTLRLSRETMILMLLLFLRLGPRIMELQQEIQDILVNLSSFTSMRKLESACLENQEPMSDAQHLQLHQRIVLEHVSFRYPGADKLALRDITAVIPAGQVTALIAASGGGKSTLADLLLGLGEAEAGSVWIDHARLDSGSRRAWRDQVAYVPQDVFLLNDTLAANLRLTAPAASEDDLWRVLAAARLDAVVRRTPLGLKMMIGDRGVRLSGGERQRLAIARALLRRPQLLILDEATSALDWENQSAIAEVIERLKGRLTVITIAHRPSMIYFADWIIALEDGRLVEMGPYQNLADDPSSRLAKLLAAEPQ